MTHKVLLLSGKQGSGKTTIMEELKKRALEQGIVAKNVIFADTIYRIHDFAIDLLKQRGIERDIVKDGKLLQLLGTEWGRYTVNENIWVDCLKGQIAQLEQEYKSTHKTDGNCSPRLYIVSDCRFKNEFDGIDAFKVRLEASREVRKERCSQWRDTDTHPSETDLDEYAVAGKFHCYVDTEGDFEKSVSHITRCFDNWVYDNHVEMNGFDKVQQKHYLLEEV